VNLSRGTQILEYVLQGGLTAFNVQFICFLANRDSFCTGQSRLISSDRGVIMSGLLIIDTHNQSLDAFIAALPGLIRRDDNERCHG
jgi:hypothetical protein